LKRILIQTAKYLFFLLFGVFLLWLSFRKLSLDAVWDDIRHAHYSWMLLALVFAFAAHAFRALRWNLLINSLGYKTRLATTFYAVMIGYMANTAVPRMGEFMRCGVLSRKEKIPFNALFGTVISERFFDLIVLMAILFGVIFFQWKLLGSFVTRMTKPLVDTIQEHQIMLFVMIAILIVLIGLAIYLFYFFRERFRKMPGYSKTMELLRGLSEGVKTIQRVKQKGMFTVYTILIWFMYALMLYIPFFMLDETSGLDFIASVTMLAIGSLGIVAPVPGGIGAYHFIGKSVLVELYNVPGVAAGSFVALTHAGQTLLHIIMGGLSYFVMFFVDHKKALNDEK